MVKYPTEHCAEVWADTWKDYQMNVTYRYSSLAAIADYYDNKASEERLKAMRPTDKIRLRDRLAATERAVVYESVAYMLRNTEIEIKK